VIFLDVGHGYKGTDQRYDPGASMPVSAPGEHPTEPEPHRTEAVIVRWLGAALSSVLHQERAPHMLVPDLGRYADRHRWVGERVQLLGGGPHLYVQLHCNAGGGSYALVEYDQRSSRGAEAAGIIAERLGMLDGVTEGQVRSLSAGERGHTCISGIWPIRGCAAVLVEPGFLDQSTHRHLWQPAGISAIAERLAQGVLVAVGA
jgi:N-acetylmuramoyl-L-alanine amidase